MISCLSFGSDIFDTSLLLMFMSSCHKWNVALFHGFHLGFACCVVLAHVIVTTKQYLAHIYVYAVAPPARRPDPSPGKYTTNTIYIIYI